MRFQEKLAGLGFIGGFISRTRLQEELDGVERNRAYALEQIKEKSREVEEVTKLIRAYTTAQKAPGIIDNARLKCWSERRLGS